MNNEESPARQAVEIAEGQHDAIEIHTRTPRAQHSVSASTKSRLTELIPLAVTRLADAVEQGESWAIRLVLEAAGLERIASKVLEDPGEEAGSIISTAFERELITNLLQTLRNPSAGQPAGETRKGTSRD